MELIEHDVKSLKYTTYGRLSKAKVKVNDTTLAGILHKPTYLNSQVIFYPCNYKIMDLVDHLCDGCNIFAINVPDEIAKRVAFIISTDIQTFTHMLLVFYALAYLYICYRLWTAALQSD